MARKAKDKPKRAAPLRVGCRVVYQLHPSSVVTLGVYEGPSEHGPMVRSMTDGRKYVVPPVGRCRRAEEADVVRYNDRVKGKSPKRMTRSLLKNGMLDELRGCYGDETVVPDVEQAPEVIPEPQPESIGDATAMAIEQEVRNGKDK